MSFASPEQQREYQRLWIKRRRESYLADKSCVRCGSTEQLTLDHIEPSTKTIPIAQVWSMSLSNPKRVAELAKCQVLCDPCHKSKTHLNGEKARGSYSGTSKLYEHDVPEIRRLVSSGVSMHEVSRRFEVDEGTIRAIIAGRTWKHVSGG